MPDPINIPPVSNIPPVTEVSQTIVNPVSPQPVQSEPAPPVEQAAPVYQVATPIPSTQFSFLRPVLFSFLSGIGAFGFAELLFFAFVEFSNFEQGLIDQLILPDKIPWVGFKAALIIFSTALAFFFAFQLGLLRRDENKPQMKYALSGIAGVVATILLLFAQSIQIVSVFD